MQSYADSVLEDGGIPSMIRSMEDLAEEGGVATHAPLEFADLRASGHPSVVSGSETVYDRPPRIARLTEDELKAKDEAREALDKLTGGAWGRGQGHGSRRPGGINVIHPGKP